MKKKKKASAKPVRKKTVSKGVPMAKISDLLPKPIKNSKHWSTKRINPKWDFEYQKLLQLRTDLLDHIDGLAKNATEQTATYSMHMADAGTDSFDRDFALSMLTSDRNSLYEIEEAIKRIENGSYGICEMTGKAITRERLRAIPWTRFSVAAQQKLEREGGTLRTHFGELGSVQSSDSRESEDSEDSDEKEG